MKIKAKNIYLGYLSYFDMNGAVGRGESIIEVLINVGENQYRFLDEEKIYNLKNDNFLVDGNSAYRIDNLHNIEEVLNKLFKYPVDEYEILKNKEYFKSAYWVRYGELMDADKKQMSLLNRKSF